MARYGQPGQQQLEAKSGHDKLMNFYTAAATRAVRAHPFVSSFLSRRTPSLITTDNALVGSSNPFFFSRSTYCSANANTKTVRYYSLFIQRGSIFFLRALPAYPACATESMTGRRAARECRRITARNPDGVSSLRSIAGRFWNGGVNGASSM